MNPIEIVLVITGVVCLFFAPSLIASRRRHHQTPAIVALNILFGFTGIGWGLALIWSLTAVRTA